MPGGPQDAELIKAAMLIDQQVLERGVAIRPSRSTARTVIPAPWPTSGADRVRARRCAPRPRSRCACSSTTGGSPLLAHRPAAQRGRSGAGAPIAVR
ncbi:hypothetical protein [Nonomuraea dietziae]|uniref:hypothetical protein n=1 Tax=Nonomuraea dietziae TaxID=65515 RepID=UPI0031DA30BE